MEKIYPDGKRYPEGEIFPVEKIFPLNIREALHAASWQEGSEEIRIRIGQPVEFLYGTGSRYLVMKNGTCSFCDVREAESAEEYLYRVRAADIAEMLNYISNYSLYAYREEVKQGFITIQGGHRIGIAGTAAVEGGKIAGMSHITFLNIRIAHERTGCADKLLPFLFRGRNLCSTLLISAPGAGKTTYLRDSIRALSEGTRDMPGMRVCVVDERSEIAACHRGVPQNDLGPRTDVLDGCPKAEGMLLMLRAMSPQVIAVDELGTEKDFMAVEQAACSGSRILGTVHAGEIGELTGKPHMRRWLGNRIFERYVLIRRQENGERRFEIFDEALEQLC